MFLLSLCCLDLTFDSGNPVLSLLQGAGLLQNLTQIAEKARDEDNHVLTDKLEMVKGMLYPPKNSPALNSIFLDNQQHNKTCKI